MFRCFMTTVEPADKLRKISPVPSSSGAIPVYVKSPVPSSSGAIPVESEILAIPVNSPELNIRRRDVCLVTSGTIN